MTTNTYLWTAPRTIYRIHGCCFGKVVNYHGSDRIEDIFRLESEWKKDQEINSISIYKNAELIKEWRN